ncbi:MAG: chemotaxis protein CheC [candidate division WOR-3 bacterium]|nr:MAG: chemotaxis protein CheC [candidate division WOR-3 bacterium]
MTIIKSLSDIEIDALKEVANISGSHAANALYQLLDKKVMIQVPKAVSGNLGDVMIKIAEPHDVVISVVFNFIGDIRGKTLIIYPCDEITSLTSMLLRENHVQMQESFIREMSSILSCAYVNAISNLLNILIIPSIPSMTLNILGNTFSNVVHSYGEDKDFVFCIVTECKIGEEGEPLNAYFMFLPESDSLKKILGKMNLRD